MAVRGGGGSHRNSFVKLCIWLVREKPGNVGVKNKTGKFLGKAYPSSPWCEIMRLMSKFCS